MKKILMIAPLVLVLASCNKNHDASAIAYQVKSGNRSYMAGQAGTSGLSAQSRTLGTGTLEWTSGHALVQELEFEAEQNNLEVEFKKSLNQEVDLFSPLSSLGVVNVPPGLYEEIEFQIEVRPSGSAPAFTLDGSYTSGGVSTPVSFRLDAPLEIESEKENIMVTDGASYTALTTLDLSLIATGATDAQFGNAVRTNGVIVISATSNPELYQIFYNNLKSCGGVEVDD